jgi:hypothetical protein
MKNISLIPVFHASNRVLFLTLSLFTFHLSLVLALPLQKPAVGTYQCFSSQDDPFDENAQDIGATLEIVDATTYRFTTASAREEGTVSSSEFQSGEPVFDALWQGGSLLSLQPSSGSAPYEGAFFTDTFGGHYVIIQNNNGLYIRCQSQGADLAAVIDSARAASTETGHEELPTEETQTVTPSTDSSESLQPLPAVQSGAYTCSYSYETIYWASTDDPSYYEDDDPYLFAAFIFDDGNLLTVDLASGHTFNSLFEKGRYTFDAAQSNISVEGSSLAGLTLAYGNNAAGVAALSYSRTEYDEAEDKKYISAYACAFGEALPAGMTAASIEGGTPKVELGNITVAASKYDANNPDPSIIPMTDTYYCYPSFDSLDIGDGFPNYLREYQLDIFPNTQYRFNGQTGEFRTGVDDHYLQWVSGPLNPTKDVVKGDDDVLVPHSSSVDYSMWGSEITGVEIPDGDSEIKVDCYQQGAREQKALIDFALKQPTPGNYGCLTSGDNPQQLTLELLSDNQYTFGGQTGSYRVKVGENSTDIRWASGPLGGDTSYEADDETGVRTILFTSTQSFGAVIPTGFSTETTMVCESVAPANLIPKYGSTPAPPPPTLSGGLEAFYARAEYDQGDIINGVSPMTTWYFYHFLPDGYVYEDGYATGEECGKTYPNGKSVCRTYTAQGNTITFGDGRKLALLPADSGNGDVIIEGQLYENKKLEGPQTLDGTFEYVEAYSSPMYMQMSGMGTNSVNTWTYTFKSDGTYDYTFDGWSQTSAPALFSGEPMGTIGALGSSGSSEGDSGTYTIDGNIITFQSTRGFTKTCGFFFPQNGDTTSVNICGQDYDVPSHE